MKSAAGRYQLMVMLTAVACIARGQDPRNARDTVFLRNGEKLVGKITGFDGQNIRMQRFLPPLHNAPPDTTPLLASVTVVSTHVSQVEFASDEARDQKLRRATAANTSDIEALWREALPWLAIPRSPAGEIGLSYANVLLRGGDFANARKALEIFRIVEAGAWSDRVVTRAREGRLRAMIATGSAQEAVAEAMEIERTAEDPAVLIEAKFILAQAADKALRSFVAENPRWAEDAYAQPERNRLYDKTLELYLYPALFFGSEVDTASRGLWSVVEVSRFAGDLKQALEASRDLVSIYPESVHAKQAQAFLETLPDSFKKQNHDTPVKP